MSGLRSVLAGAVALGVVLAAAPAFAQGWYDDGYRHHWRPHHERYYDRPRYNSYDVDAGVTDIAICPPGYHLGRSGRLCWPD